MLENAQPRSHRFYLWFAAALFTLFTIVIVMGAVLNFLLYVSIRIFLFAIFVIVIWLLWRALMVSMRRPTA